MITNIESKAELQIKTLILVKWVKNEDWFNWSGEEAHKKIEDKAKELWKNLTNDVYWGLALSTMKVIGDLS